MRSSLLLPLVLAGSALARIPISPLPRPNACAALDTELSIFCCEKTQCPQVQNGTLTACFSPWKIFAWADCIDEQVALNASAARFDDGGLIVCSQMGGAGRAGVGAGVGVLAAVAMVIGVMV